MTEGALRESTVDTSRLSRLFTAMLEFTSDSPVDAVVPSDGRDGAYIGSGTGSISGDQLRGTMSWSRYARKLPVSAHPPRRGGSR